jgi:tetratricopeptide (TPR) repeat protein
MPHESVALLVPVVLLVSPSGRALLGLTAGVVLAWLNLWWLLPVLEVPLGSAATFVLLDLPRQWWVNLLGYPAAIAALLAALGVFSPAVGSLAHQAAQAARRGDHLAAGELLLQAGRLRRALRHFVRARAWERAGEVARTLGQTHRAAEMFKRAGGPSLALAAQTLSRVGEEAQAIQLWLRYGHYLVESGQPELAIDAFLRGEDPRRACRAVEMALRSHRLSGAVADSALRATRLARLPALGAQVALACGRLREAGDLFLAAGQPEAAARAYERAGEPLRAADALRQAGHTEQATRLRARHLEATGQFEAAAIEYQQSGLDAEAAVALLHLGRWQEAMERFRAAGRLADAAQVARTSGNVRQAAELYQEIEEWELAGECWLAAQEFGAAAQAFERAGDFERAMEMLDRGGFSERRAQLMAKLGRVEEALATLVREGHLRAAHDMLRRYGGSFPHLAGEIQQIGEWLESNGEITGAIAVLQRATAGAPVTRELLPVLYRQGLLLERRGDVRNAEIIFQRIADFDYAFRDAAERAQRLAARLSATTAGEAATASPDPSDTASRYVLEEELGRGGMGVVYRATDLRLRRTVAIKVLNPHQLTEEAMARFEREARAAAVLSHPGIVHIYDFARGFGSAYISMEYVDGVTLNHLLRTEPEVVREQLLPLAMQVAEAVAFAHARGVIHRDLKPANMVVSQRRTVKILDFGIARRLDESEPELSGATGTPYYMAPEQILGEPPDQRSDIYSLGVTFFQMATGTLPFTTGNILRAHIEQPPPDPLALNPTLNPALGAVILRCLAKDPADRPADGGALHALLTAIAQGSQLP